jgi:ubiquinol-cytochrome c reductase cytochrome c1 subunit
MIIRLIVMLLICFTPLHAFSSSANGIELEHVSIDLSNKASLQRGASIFMNYCSGCHSLKYLRYSRIAKDLGLTTFEGDIDTDLLINNLIFSKVSIYEPIEIAMPREDARQWFGTLPPDLSLTGRVRGADWIYTYLKSFYKDSSRPFGVNNLLIPGVAMPNVLAPLEGEQIAVKTKKTFLFGGKERTEETISHLVLVSKGLVNQHQFDQMIQDLVNFLVYTAEPVKLVRYKIGVAVLLFLVILLVFSYLLKKLYWKKVK